MLLLCRCLTIINSKLVKAYGKLQLPLLIIGYVSAADTLASPLKNVRPSLHGQKPGGQKTYALIGRFRPTRVLAA
jgi:hypothetical protein